MKILKRLMKNCDILDIEDFKTFLTKTKWVDGTKANAVDVYRCYAKYKGFKVENLPKYCRDSPLPFIPLEREIDALISGCGRKTSTFLELLTETAFRPIEGLKLKWRDIDTERYTVNLTKPAKYSKPRQPKISSKLLSMLLSLPHNSEYIFITHEPSEKTLDYFRRSFEMSRKRLAKKLQNPRLMKISFRTLRHWKATVTYQKTKDILYVKEMLGHKRLQNTLIYTHLTNFKSDEYAVKVAKTLQEACKLVEDGFEYITEMNEAQIFRKRK